MRYVGRTTKATARLTQHIRAAKKGNRAPRSEWIRDLLQHGLVPEVLVLEIDPAGGWSEAEIAWIAYLRTLGCSLTNVTSGGEGWSNPIEMREHLRQLRLGTTLSAETRAKIGAAGRGRPGVMKGKRHSAEAIAKMKATRKGKSYGPHLPHRPDSRAKLSESLTKYYATHEVPLARREKIRKAKLGHEVTEDTRRKISAGLVGRKQDPQEARQSAENMRYGLHVRWHVNRDIVKADCRFCSS